LGQNAYPHAKRVGGLLLGPFEDVEILRETRVIRVVGLPGKSIHHARYGRKPIFSEDRVVVKFTLRATSLHIPLFTTSSRNLRLSLLSELSCRLSRRVVRYVAVGSLGTAFVAVLTGCGAGTAAPVSAGGDAFTLSGKVKGGQQPVSNATIQLYAAGTGTTDATAATPLIGTPAILTGAAGDFTITGRYTCPSITSEVYLVATGGNPGLAAGTNNQALALISGLGPCGNLTSATHIIINEVTTIGTIYSITPFMSSYLNVGSTNADFNTFANDFMLINQYIDTSGGASPGPALPGGFSAPIPNLYTLANAMATCINSTGGVAKDGTNCGKFLDYATPPGGTAPTNTADAILDIANNPTNNVGPIFSLAPANDPFQPTLTSAPADWTLKILPNITLATSSTLVGVGSTNTGTITLGQAAPTGGLSVSISSDNTGFVSVVSPVVIASGATSGTFSYTGVATGTATLTASAPNYVSGSVSLSATSSLISLGTVPTVAPGQSVDLPLSLGTPAPAGGVTVNFVSTNTGVATISPTSVMISAGLKVPTANPKVTGVTVGTAQINASATGYAPGAQGVSVSVTASLPSTFSLPVGTSNETLTISAPAPTGGITFTLSSDNTAIFTVPSTITVAAGATTVSIPVTGVAGGTTTLRADSPNITEATSSVTVNANIAVQTSTITTGKQLQVSTYFYFATAPPAAVTATLTSSAPAVAVVSTSPTVQGGTTATVPGITSTSATTYYIQGVSVGTATITISAPGYSNSTVNVTVDPSGFVIYSPGNFSTTTLSADSSITIAPAILTGTGSVLGYASVTPAASASITVTSSNTAVGTIVSSPLAYGANDYLKSVNFHPLSSGTSNISISTPSGFSTPTPAATQQITATVTAPPISVQTSAITTGAALEVSTYAYLSQAPTVATNVSITSSNPSVAVVSLSTTAAGASTVTVPAVVSTSAFTYYIQGISVGTTTLTISASPYSDATVNVTVDPSGFVIYSPGNFSTTDLSTATSITIAPAILTPGSLTVLGYANVSPLYGTVSVPVNSSNTAAGTISSSPVVYHAGDYLLSTNFTPVAAGTSNISLGTPGGFSTPAPAATQQIVATVTAPPISVQTTAITTGNNLTVSTYGYLSQTPTTPVTVTITSSVPAVATVSASAGTAGAAYTTFANTVSTSAFTYYVQGQSVGTTVLTITAPGYANATVNVTVDPSGFVIYSPGNFSTTTFSSSTSITLAPAILTPGSLTVLGYASLNPGIGNVTVPVNSSATQVGTVTSPVTYTAGSYLLSSTFQPVAAGTSNISIGTPAGFSTPAPAATQQIVATVTAPPISVQTSSITTGANLEVSTYAYLSQTPPSAVTVTVTSNDTSKVTLSTSPIAVGAGSLSFTNTSTTSAFAYYIQGHATGTTTLTLSAPGYSNATVNVTVDPSGFVIYSPGNFSTTTFSTATSLTLAPAILTPGSLTVLGYATLSPGVGSPSITVTSSNPAVGTVTSPVTYNAGDYLNSATFQPTTAGGTTNLSISTPAGYSTPLPASTQQITATVTAPPVSVQTSAITTGANLQVSTYAYLSQTPPSAETLTITSSNPSVAVISKSATSAGASSISFTGVANTSALTYYIQGLATGTSTITLSAAGFTSATVSVTVDPSGFVIYSPGNFSTTTFSAATSITLAPAILTPGTLTVLGYASVNPGVSVNVPVTSSVPGVGTVTSPVAYTTNGYLNSASFQPVSAGSTVVSITTEPAGFSTPSQSSATQITATVTAPPISVQTSTITTGANLQVSTYVYLSQTPPSAVTLTLTSSNPTVATLSASASTTGTAILNFTGDSSTTAMTYYIQGLTTGTSTITISAAGFANATVNVTVDPSGFVIYSPGNFSTTTTSADTSITIVPAILNSGVLTVLGYASLNPGIGTVTVPVGSTSPQIGTVSPTSIPYGANDYLKSTTFHPLTIGTTDVVIVSQPSGFTTPSQPATQQIVVTVQ
jgi:hypothetical protein